VLTNQSKRNTKEQSMPLTAKPYLQTASIRTDADIDFSAYPHNIPAVREMGKIEFHADVTFLMGENGAGKSTVLEAIALALGYGPEGGTKKLQVGDDGRVVGVGFQVA
jgi:predicted ATPase